MVVTRSGKIEEMGRCWSKETKLKLYRMSKSRELIYSIMTGRENRFEVLSPQGGGR